MDRVFKVRELRWFIKKGEPVEENKPVEIKFCQRIAVTAKTIDFSLFVYCDEKTPVAPIHRNSDGRVLVTLRADLSHMSMADRELLSTDICADGLKYYFIDGAVEATYYAASTKYVINCNGRRYDTVTAEYA
jgi:hypothetical protein